MFVVKKPLRQAKTSHSAPTVAVNAMEAPARASTLIKKFGVAGFAFFFIKGMLWLAIPAALALLGR